MIASDLRFEPIIIDEVYVLLWTLAKRALRLFANGVLNQSLSTPNADRAGVVITYTHE